MDIKKIYSVFFSPTKSTERVLSVMTDELSPEVESVDVTRFSERERALNFKADELVFFGVPVYGGRVPEAAVERFGKMHGDGTPSVLVATYGNREYDDALLELKDLTERNGFVTVAAAAFITEHSIMHSVAAGRPDSTDISKIRDFSSGAWAKIERAHTVSDFTALNISGNAPYKVYGGVPMTPKADSSSCKKCGTCSHECPVNAIPEESPDMTDKARCITCMRCITICPTGARSMKSFTLTLAEKLFAWKNRRRKEPSIFI